MEKTKNDVAYLMGVVRQIDDATLSQIDFDLMKARLSAISDHLSVEAELVEQHARLRDDYEQRIGGMIKAIAAVDRKRDGWEEALALAEELPALSVEKLLKTYQRTAARFRDCFPGSFGFTRASGRGKA